MRKYAVFLNACISIEVEAEDPADAVTKSESINFVVDDKRIDVIYVEKEEVMELDESKDKEEKHEEH